MHASSMREAAGPQSTTVHQLSEQTLQTIDQTRLRIVGDGRIGRHTRSKRDLVAENAFLRQQLIVLKRQMPRPPLTARDRGLLVLLASKVRGWKDALVVVKPDTLKRWHREGFRIYWRRKSKSKPRKPRIAPEAVALIQQMALENRTWGAKRIRDELRKLGYWVSKRTVRKYMKQARRDLPPRQSSPTWATFLKNHASEI